MQLKDRDVRRVGRRKTNTSERFLELRTRPPPADVSLGLPDTNDVERVVVGCAVVAQFATGSRAPSAHDQRVRSVICAAELDDVPVKAGDQDYRVRVVQPGMLRAPDNMPRSMAEGTPRSLAYFTDWHRSGSALNSSSRLCRPCERADTGRVLATESYGLEPKNCASGMDGSRPGNLAETRVFFGCVRICLLIRRLRVRIWGHSV